MPSYAAFFIFFGFSTGVNASLRPSVASTLATVSSLRLPSSDSAFERPCRVSFISRASLAHVARTGDVSERPCNLSRVATLGGDVEIFADVLFGLEAVDDVPLRKCHFFFGHDDLHSFANVLARLTSRFWVLLSPPRRRRTAVSRSTLSPTGSVSPRFRCYEGVG